MNSTIPKKQGYSPEQLEAFQESNRKADEILYAVWADPKFSYREEYIPSDFRWYHLAHMVLNRNPDLFRITSEKHKWGRLRFDISITLGKKIITGIDIGNESYNYPTINPKTGKEIEHVQNFTDIMIVRNFILASCKLYLLQN